MRYSLSDPRCNLREIVKQLVLLEQHLLEEGKYCLDCISKHLLTIEALADEGQCLDSEGNLVADFSALHEMAQEWAHAIAKDGRKAARKVGQEVRTVRKNLAPLALRPGAVWRVEAKSNPKRYAAGRVALWEGALLLLAVGAVAATMGKEL